MRQAGILSATANFKNNTTPLSERLSQVDNPQVAKYIAQLKDKNELVRGGAAWALGQISDVAAVPAIISALRDKSLYVRERAIEALGEIGDSHTLPRKILADSRLSAQERIDALETLRQVHHHDNDLTLRYIVPDTRILCQAVLHSNLNSE